MAVKIATQNYCRLCGQEKEHLAYIFDKEDLIENIERYLQILIFKEDSLPHEICDTCENEIKNIVQYITGCQRAQRELHKLPTRERLKISTDAIKLEDLPLQITETKVDFDSGSFDVHSDFWNRRNSIMFTWMIPELPTTDNGKPNSSILITTNSDSNQLSELQAMGRDNLKQLGKNIYQKYFLQLLEKRHLELTFTDIEEDFIRFQRTLEREDPLLQENHTDNKNEKLGFQLTVPTVLIESLRKTASPVSDPVESPANTSSGPIRASENLSKFLTCIHCPFETTQRFRLNQHYREVHEKPFSCDQCERRFGKESKLVLHKKAEHTDLNPVICSLCNMSFRQRYYYKQHLKTHSNNDSLWFCNYCKENFSHQHKLDVHMARFHKSKSVKCSRCSYIAAHKYQIKQHMREVHLKPIECAECGKRESKKCRMEAHIKSKHMAKTMYECEVCTTKYTSKKWFESHQKKGCPGAFPISNPDVVSERRLP